MLCKVYENFQFVIFQPEHQHLNLSQHGKQKPESYLSKLSTLQHELFEIIPIIGLNFLHWELYLSWSHIDTDSQCCDGLAVNDVKKFESTSNLVKNYGGQFFVRKLTELTSIDRQGKVFDIKYQRAFFGMNCYAWEIRPGECC